MKSGVVVDALIKDKNASKYYDDAPQKVEANIINKTEILKLKGV